MIDAVLAEAVPAAEAPANLAEAYAAQAGWDPRTDGGDYVYLVLQPERIQVWREGEDLAGRTVMRKGTWVTREDRPNRQGTSETGSSGNPSRATE
jgi:hypothetical protein